jgi:hypothetical protein
LLERLAQAGERPHVHVPANRFARERVYLTAHASHDGRAVVEPLLRFGLPPEQAEAYAQGVRWKISHFTVDDDST